MLFFFKEFLNSTFLKSIENFDSNPTLQKKGLETFVSFFPRYTWASQEFYIKYELHGATIEIRNTILASGKDSLKLTYSAELKAIRIRLKKSYKKFLSEIEEDTNRRYLPPPFWKFSRENIWSDAKCAMYFPEAFFIPASRSFFANLQKNVFSFLASNIDIDPFIKEFGSNYESAKRIYNNQFELRREQKQFIETKKHATQLIENILVGKYVYSDEKDWIENKGNRVNLTNASSGQQEALPMLLILSVFPYMGSNNSSTYFIEEPEAHLFPTAQKQIALLITLLHNLGHSFVLTTHSPYILTALNNMILSADIRETNSTKKFEKKFPRQFDLKFEDVNASTLRDGKLQEILDYENKLIGTSIIDEVSDVFEREFDELLKFAEP